MFKCPICGKEYKCNKCSYDKHLEMHDAKETKKWERSMNALAKNLKTREGIKKRKKKGTTVTFGKKSVVV